jgi:CRISPR-associated protein (Cas_Csd1).
MILQALKEYYDRKAADPESDIAPEGWEKKEIPFIIVLDSDGSLVRIEDTREGEGKKKRAKTFLVPQAVKKTSGIAANLLWDVAGYVFGVDKKGNKERDEEKDKKRARNQKETFINRLKNELGDIDIVQAVIGFLQNVTEERLLRESCWKEICDTNPNLSFRLNTDTYLVCRHPEVVTKLSVSAKERPNENQGICLMTGERTNIKNCTLLLRVFMAHKVPEQILYLLIWTLSDPLAKSRVLILRLESKLNSLIPPPLIHFLVKTQNSV